MDATGQIRYNALVRARRGPTLLGAGAKRAFDLIVASSILIVTSPLLLALAVAIKLDSRGPVFFFQDRVGSRRRWERDGVVWASRIFRICKFRSMHQDVDDTAHREYAKAFVRGTASQSGKEGSRYKLVGDPRVTRVGRFLRATSLDELPQLINVVKGDMSLVGPRPVPEYEVAEYEKWQYERLHALPGITGYWQVHGRGNVSFDEMMQMDLHYVRNRSLWLDVKLLFLTLPAVLSSKGAE